jgi:hypothetical protein
VGEASTHQDWLHPGEIHMTESAANGADGSGENQANSQSGQHVPLSRLNEVLERVRTLEQNEKVKDQLINHLQNSQRPAQNQDPSISAEKLGMDEATFQAVRQIVLAEVAPKVKKVEAFIANVANTQDELMFVQKHGSDKMKHLDRIRQYQSDHYRRTGLPIDSEHAFAMIHYADSQNKQQPQAPVAPVVQAQPAQPAAPIQAPGPTGGAAQAPAKSLAEMTVEEMEAHLNQQLSGNSI